MLNKFTFLQKIRNKIRIKSNISLTISKTAKIVGCSIVSKSNTKNPAKTVKKNITWQE